MMDKELILFILYPVSILNVLKLVMNNWIVFYSYVYIWFFLFQSIFILILIFIIRLKAWDNERQRDFVENQEHIEMLFLEHQNLYQLHVNAMRRMQYILMNRLQNPIRRRRMRGGYYCPNPEVIQFS